jgi:hypothetical protein
MIDLETLSTLPDATILTIAAQGFDPFGIGYHEKHTYYARITLESQKNRSIEEGTISWWATQPEAQAEALMDKDRVPLDTALDALGKLIWHSNYLWSQGPTFDCTILEQAYKSYNKPLPWQYYRVRDSRTVLSLYPDLPKPSTSHHALEDCRRQIDMLQATFRHLNITTIK